jgi:hypothetical protein
MDGHLVKPFEMDELLDVVAQYLPGAASPGSAAAAA